MPEKKTIVHNSQMKSHRSPCGAVCANTKIRLSIDVDAAQKATGVMLRVWRENVGETLLPMEKNGAGGQPVRWNCTLEVPEIGTLLWYYFIVSCEEGTLFYGNNAEKLGGEGQIYEQVPPSFQITVYSEGAATPDWFKHAVVYQIFPDRFYRKGEVLAQKKGAVLHSVWENTPFYIKDADTRELVAYDFFGGNFAGIKEKLPYLKDLGINVLYLNPIFESISNHRYDTGDYHKVDAMLGTNEEFSQLCAAAKEMGMRVILDGVFSHTGSDSKYFNREGNYDSVGAFQSPQSPYFEWYNFKRYPYEYESWWGFHVMPNVEETTQSYMDFIINDQNSVLRYWLRQGISGWRLDVLDELPPAFSQRFYQVLKEEDPEAVLIGEVWEDASNKVSYGMPREYLCGGEIDSVMNYPFRKILLDFVLNHVDARETNRRILSLMENYPKENFYAMLNLVGSHDVERVMTLLGEAPYYDGMPAIQQARARLSNDQYQLATARIKLLSLWQMTFPGAPCVYYGDETGMQGFKDPYNRGTYPWGREDDYLIDWYKKIIALRNAHPALRTGELLVVYDRGDVYGYVRRIRGGQDVFGGKAEDDTFLIALNRNRRNCRAVTIPVRGICRGTLCDVLGKADPVRVASGKVTFYLQPLQCVVFRQVVEAKMTRKAGVLLHPSSLPSHYGIGDLGKWAYEFVNFLEKGRQKYWQILPLNPVGYGYSPYQSPSAFAGNPMLISLGKLVIDELLTPYDCKVSFDRAPDFEMAGAFKTKCLRLAYTRFAARPFSQEYKAFCEKENKWLEDYALFMSLKEQFGGASWHQWESGLKRRDAAVLEQYRSRLGEEIGYHKFLQFVFFKQWKALHRYANQHGVQIIGDMPIFIAHDSADVWSHQELFALDEEGKPEKVAGVPPDYFCATGQLWGNPHYRWDRMRQDDYAWWRDRFTTLLEMVDYIRVDHFRGFESYWEVAGNAATAIDGIWAQGPGSHFFKTLEKYFGKMPIIAEDLGIITEAVTDLKDEFSFPGMKVLHFELYLDEEQKVKFTCEQNCVVYTGTHDNNTTVGWLTQDVDASTRRAVGALLKADEGDAKALDWALIAFAYASNAATAIVPMQDLLQLDGDARMNKPGTVGDNWQWRMDPGACSAELAEKLAGLCRTHKR